MTMLIMDETREILQADRPLVVYYENEFAADLEPGLGFNGLSSLVQALSVDWKVPVGIFHSCYCNAGRWDAVFVIQDLETVEEYRTSMEFVASILVERCVRVVLGTTTHVNEGADPVHIGKNAVIDTLNSVLIEVANAYDIVVVDLAAMMNSEIIDYLSEDGVHFNAEGEWLSASLIANSLLHTNAYHEYASVEAAAAAVPRSGYVDIEEGLTQETFVIDRAVTLRAESGLVTIGATVSEQADGLGAGFISRHEN